MSTYAHAQNVSPFRDQTRHHLVGASRATQQLQRDIERVARSDAKVLITGESGVGKEVVARSIHAQSLRSSHPFVAVNCAGLPESLLESELFGHVKGSFTGAYRDTPGKFESAHNGTIFLDEIGEMTLHMQTSLLRFLETGELQKVGSDSAARHVNVRVIAATNCNLQSLIREGTFREDLYYRLNVVHIDVPPLRDRRDDVPLLIEHFFDQFRHANHASLTGISPDAVRALTAYSWPGNVRELENVIERLVVTAQGPVIELSDLSPEMRLPQNASTAPRPEVDQVVAAELFDRMLRGNESFWDSVYDLFMKREITRATVRAVVSLGLEEARGNYRIVARLFNLAPEDYKRFLNVLRKHGCNVPFREFR